MTTPSNPEFDAECIRRILAGEKHLFHDLIRPCERSIYFLLLSLLANEAEAEDVAQETFLQLWRRPTVLRTSLKSRKFFAPNSVILTANGPLTTFACVSTRTRSSAAMK